MEADQPDTDPVDVLVHAGFFLPITVTGILCLLRAGLSFAELRMVKIRNSPPSTSLASDHEASEQRLGDGPA